MAYDDELEARVRARIGDEPLLSEQRMFGGLAFLIGGNLAVGASTEGLLVRTAAAESERVAATTGAELMEMRGRPMRGWLRVPPHDVQTDEQLAGWVEIGTSYARSLPAKPSSALGRRARTRT